MNLGVVFFVVIGMGGYVFSFGEGVKLVSVLVVLFSNEDILVCKQMYDVVVYICGLVQLCGCNVEWVECVVCEVVSFDVFEVVSQYVIDFVVVSLFDLFK